MAPIVLVGPIAIQVVGTFVGSIYYDALHLPNHDRRTPMRSVEDIKAEQPMVNKSRCALEKGSDEIGEHFEVGVGNVPSGGS